MAELCGWTSVMCTQNCAGGDCAIASDEDGEADYDRVARRRQREIDHDCGDYHETSGSR